MQPIGLDNKDAGIIGLRLFVRRGEDEVLEDAVRAPNLDGVIAPRAVENARMVFKIPGLAAPSFPTMPVLRKKAVSGENFSPLAAFPTQNSKLSPNRGSAGTTAID